MAANNSAQESLVRIASTEGAFHVGAFHATRKGCATCEVAGTGRISLDPKPYFNEEILRFQSAVWTYPNDVKGTSILNRWPYDATRYPDFFGYLPSFKRVRRFPTNQRFEPVIAGSTFYLTAMQLVPEVFIIELEPTGYPRAPYSKKRIWFDARTMTPMVMNSFDRRGQVWKQWEGGFDTWDKNGNTFKSNLPHPVWSWTHVHSHDIQSDRITIFQQVPEISGGYRTTFNDNTAYEKYTTEAAIRRLGT
jgi:hypothetical protein